MKNYKYLKAIKFSVISKMLGYFGQGIRPNTGGHERLFERLNDAVGEVIEGLGSKSYEKNHKFMNGNPKK